MGEATLVVDGLTLTEGLRWHDGRVWFSDLYNRRVVSILEDGSDLRVEGQFEAIPVGLGWLPDGRLLVIQQETAKVLRREHDGTFVVHADLSGVAKSWPNDIVVTGDGTAYVGCFGFELHQGAPFGTAPLMKVTVDGQVTVVGEPSYFPNGSTILDGTLVVAESFGNRISQYDIDPDGTLSNRRDWAVFGPMPTASDLDDRYKELVVAADGISGVDAEGAIWVADFTKQHAVRVLPGAEIVDEVTTGSLNCYCVALGGHDGRTLFLCATPAEMDPELRKNEPRGTIMSCRVDVPLA
jgi:sugar lactone lactonase YvrE